MPARVGTYTLDDLIGVDDQTIAEFGEDAVADAVQRDLDNLNAQVREGMVGDLVEMSPDRLRRYGASTEGEFVELDELGYPAAQKTGLGQNVGFPLSKFGRALAWTRDFMTAATPNDVAVMTRTVEADYLRNVKRLIRRAVFGSANYTVTDRFVAPRQAKIELPVKRLLNADGVAIPNGPNGEAFDGATESHFLATDWSGATAAQKQASIEAAVDDLVEHGHGDDVRVYINKAEQDDFAAMPGFKWLSDSRIVYMATDFNEEELDRTRVDDRKIGTIGAADVYVKPWVPPAYQLVFAAGDDAPVVLREHTVQALRGLRLAFEVEGYPLRAQGFESYLGAGVWNRSNGVVHYSGGGTYTDPAFA